jgi:hypothetical protein
MYDNRYGREENEHARGQGDPYGGSPLRKHERGCLLFRFAVSGVGIRRHVDDDGRLDGDLMHTSRLVHRLVALAELDGSRHDARALRELPEDHVDWFNLRPIPGVYATEFHGRPRIRREVRRRTWVGRVLRSGLRLRVLLLTA